MKFAPCAALPGRAANSIPRRTARLSTVSPLHQGIAPGLGRQAQSGQ